MDTERMPLIYKAIIGVMQDIGAVGKDQINKQQGWKFRGIDDVMNALHPAMVKHGVFAVPEIVEQNREVKVLKSGTSMIFSVCRIRYTFYAEDGTYVQATVVGEGMDTGDKATNKAMAIAFKYACFQVFCIPTEEMVDPDSERPEIEEEEKEKKKANKKEQKAPENKQAEADRKDGTSNEHDEKSDRITEAMLATIHAEMDRTGVKVQQILSAVGKPKASLEDLNIEDFKKIMNKFKVTQKPERGAA